MKKLFPLLLSLLLTLTVMCYPAAAAGYTVICEPQYNMAETFDGTVTKVSKNSRWALAGLDGIAFTDYKWEAMGDTTSEYIPAKSNGKWGYIAKDGSVLISYQFITAGQFSDGIAKVQTENGAQCYINTSGKVQFTSPFVNSFSSSGGAICGSTAEGLYGYCDTTGGIIITPKYDMAFDFHEGYAAVKSGSKWGYINTYGTYSVRPAFDYASDFKNGYAVCRLGNKYGIINTSGNHTSAFTFDYIGVPDDSGRYPAKDGSTSGYIDFKGDWVLKTKYDYCYSFTDGVARVYKEGVWGFIDEQGKELVPPTFIDCGEYRNGRAPFSTDGSLWGYITIDTTKPNTTVKPNNPGGTDTQSPSKPTTQNPAQNPPSEPLAPDASNCISMRIGSTVSLYSGGTKQLATAPKLYDGTTMVPVRDIVELLDGSIAWDGKKQQITISYNYKTIIMHIGSTTAYVGDDTVTMPQAPVLSEGCTLIPLRSVADSLNCDVKWDGKTQNIYIYY